MNQYTKAVQAQMIAFLLQKVLGPSEKYLSPEKQPGVRLFKYFKEVDSAVFQKTFSFEGIRQIITLLGRYYEEYKDLPGYTTYQDYRGKDYKFQLWLKSATTEEQQELKRTERELFKPIENPSYTQKQILDFIALNKLSQLALEQAEAISKGETGLEVFKRFTEAKTAFMFKLQSELEPEGEFSYIISKKPKMEGLAGVAPIPTIFPALNIHYQGLTVIFAPAKSFKSGTAQSIAVGLMEEGYDVFYLDLENGEPLMRRRFYQALTNSRKEWFYPYKDFPEGIFLELPEEYSEYNRTKEYNQGDEVFRVFYFHNKKSKLWRFECWLLKAVVDFPELDRDWERVKKLQIKILPLEEVIEEKLTEIRKRTGGQIRLQSMLGTGTPMKIEDALEKIKEELNNDFFKNPEKKKILVIDWMQLLKADGSKITDWERDIKNYRELGDIANRENLYILGIEGVKDGNKLSDPNFKLREFKPRGGERKENDAKALYIFLATEEEKQNGFGRIMRYKDRDAASGAREISYIRKDYHSMRAFSCEESEHKEGCPEFWDEKEKSKESDNQYFSDFEDAI